MLCLYRNKSETPEKRRDVIGQRKKCIPSLFTLCHRTHNAVTPPPHAITPPPHAITPPPHAIAHYPTHMSKSMIRTLLSRVGNKKH